LGWVLLFAGAKQAFDCCEEALLQFQCDTGTFCKKGMVELTHREVQGHLGKGTGNNKDNNGVLVEE